MPHADVDTVRDLLSLPEPPDEVPVRVVSVEPMPGGRRLRLDIGCADGDPMPAFLLLPDGVQRLPGVVFHAARDLSWQRAPSGCSERDRRSLRSGRR